MIDADRVDPTLTTPEQNAEQPLIQSGKKRWLAWHRGALLGITLISVLMNFYQLG